jgi:hypothetical protein
MMLVPIKRFMAEAQEKLLTLALLDDQRPCSC